VGAVTATAGAGSPTKTFVAAGTAETHSPADVHVSPAAHGGLHAEMQPPLWQT
jgi:hypothetical protein